MANIVIIEPFYGGSHRQWADGWQKNSRHQITVLGLPAHNWKWRMHGGAITLAQQYLQLDQEPDWIIATDMLDLTTFLALIHKKYSLPKVAIYFHENQLTYPWSPTDQDTKMQRDHHYQFINYVSALAADLCLFNSNYNLSSFIDSLPKFLKMFPDHQNLSSIQAIKEKSQVQYLGIALSEIDLVKPDNVDEFVPVLLWNHRWEYDKNPILFFETLFKLKEDGITFNLIAVGEKTSKTPEIFEKAKIRLKENIVHWGYCQSKTTYFSLLKSADILPVTSYQDFFGGSVIEAVYAGIHPLLPYRLAYKEHFTENLEIFYDNENMFYTQLKHLILNPKKRKNLKDKVAKYDWENIVNEYDTLFDK